MSRFFPRCIQAPFIVGVASPTSKEAAWRSPPPNRYYKSNPPLALPSLSPPGDPPTHQPPPTLLLPPTPTSLRSNGILWCMAPSSLQEFRDPYRARDLQTQVTLTGPIDHLSTLATLAVPIDLPTYAPLQGVSTSISGKWLLYFSFAW